MQYQLFRENLQKSFLYQFVFKKEVFQDLKLLLD